MGLFSKKLPAPAPLSPHQQRDRLIDGSLSGVEAAEAMLQQAMARKAQVIEGCVAAEQEDIRALERQMATAQERLQRLASLGGTVEKTEE